MIFLWSCNLLDWGLVNFLCLINAVLPVVENGCERQ